MMLTESHNIRLLWLSDVKKARFSILQNHNLGKVAEKCFLVAYMKKFLLMRNAYIKALAESGKHITHQ